MARGVSDFGRTGLGAAIARYRTAFVAVAILSAALNILLLGGSLYMMLVYDSVLPSHSLPTLFGLMAMVLVVFLFQGFFDATRTRILSDVATGLDRQMSARVQSAISEAKLSGARLPGDGLSAMRDLEQIRGFLSGSGPGTLIDLPWMIFFLGVLFLLHYWLGITALVGALVLIGLTILTEYKTRDPIARAWQIASVRNGLAEANLRHVEILSALGMRSRMQARWDEINAAHLSANSGMSRTVGLYGGIGRIFRLFLQSLILSVGAILVINGQASGGVIFASSILSSRALAPVDQAIANWRGFGAARQGWKRINELLARIPVPPPLATQLPPPKRNLVVQQLAVVPPGGQRATVHSADFTLEAGSALAIVGPSAAGKTSLGRALIGVWHPARGSVRLDGATLDQWHPDVRGAFIGYMPQAVELMEGTVADNIARFDPNADSAAVIAAAEVAGVHEMIVQLPQGYATQVGADGSELSAGQRQRIGLARALYKDPFLVLLDEPNSNLDASGEAALAGAVARVRARGGICILIAHRRSALAQVNYVLFMREGRMEAFGPRDEVLQQLASKPIPINTQRRSAPTIVPTAAVKEA